MNRLYAFGVLAACATAGARAAAQQPTFRGGGEVIRVFATVTDLHGHLATTLSQGAFDVRDEGKPQSITQFDNTPQPIRLMVMLDVSGSMHDNLPLLRGAALQLFSRLRPDDVARLGTFGNDITITPASFTRDTQALQKGLPESIPDGAPTPLWHALDEVITAFGADRDTRAVILVLSDGKDSGRVGIKQGFWTQAQIIERARAESVMIYAVGLRSREPQMPPMVAPGIDGGAFIGGRIDTARLADEEPDPGLAEVAAQTGGGYTEIHLGEDLGAAFARVADELHSQYVLGYTPPKHDGKVHTISVRVTKRGYRVRARKTYLAPKEP